MRWIQSRPDMLHNKFHRRFEEVVRTYPLRISVLRFQVNEQLLRIPIKQSRKVYDSGGMNVIRHSIVGWAEMIKV